jgi:flagellar hook-associated protein 2
VSGVTFKAEAVTTAPVEISISKDNSALTKNIDDFVAAYNAINDLLSDATKYDGSTRQAGLFQGDSTAIGLQNALRSAVQSVSTASGMFQRLADVGITQQLGGDLAVDSAKLAKALENPDEVKNMFRSTDSGSAQGVAVRIKALATSLLSVDGFFTAKESTLQLSLDRNAKDQDRVSARAISVEAQLNRRYSALDTQMASLNALNAYISQQVTAWNKSTN